MRTLSLLLAALMLAALVPTAQAAWGRTVEIRVLDAHMRPLPNAAVNVTWQLSKSKGYATTKVKYTDSRGRANFTMDNVENTPRDVDWKVTAQANYDGVRQTKSINLNLTPLSQDARTITLPVYEARFNVYGKDAAPLQGIQIELDGNHTITTDGYGRAWALLANREHTYTVMAGDMTQGGAFSIKGEDVDVPLKLSFYAIQVRVIDDAGAPVSAQVGAGSQVKGTDGQGWARFDNVSGTNITVVGIVDRYKKAVAANLEAGTEITLVFDTHAPSIEGMTAEWKGKYLQVRAAVSDPGPHASGLSAQNASVSLVYSTPNATERKVPMYAVGYNLFEGLAPADAGVKLIRYAVQATDAEGNLRVSSDTFLMPAPAEAAPPAPPAPVSPAPAEKPSSGGFDLLLPLILVLGTAAVGIGAYFYYQTRRPPSSGQGGPVRKEEGPAASAGAPRPPGIPELSRMPSGGRPPAPSGGAGDGAAPPSAPSGAPRPPAPPKPSV